MVDAIGEDIRKLLRRSDTDQTKMPVLDCPMPKMLADVDVLSALSPTNDVIAPLDAHSGVLVDRRISCRRDPMAERIITSPAAREAA